MSIFARFLSFFLVSPNFVFSPTPKKVSISAPFPPTFPPTTTFLSFLYRSLIFFFFFSSFLLHPLLCVLLHDLISSSFSRSRSRSRSRIQSNHPSLLLLVRWKGKEAGFGFRFKDQRSPRKKRKGKSDLRDASPFFFVFASQLDGAERRRVVFMQEDEIYR